MMEAIAKLLTRSETVICHYASHFLAGLPGSAENSAPHAGRRRRATGASLAFAPQKARLLPTAHKEIPLPIGGA